MTALIIYVSVLWVVMTGCGYSFYIQENDSRPLSIFLGLVWPLSLGFSIGMYVQNRVSDYFSHRDELRRLKRRNKELGL